MLALTPAFKRNLREGKIGNDLRKILTEDQACNGIDTEVFFSDDHTVTAAAKRVCETCPVLTECLAYSLNNMVDGVWGGTDWQMRKQLRRKHNIKAKPMNTTLGR